MRKDNSVKLDLTGCKYIMELHERIKTSLQFPAYYGKNWDAFRDSLMYESPADHIEIYGEHTLPKDLRPALEQMHEILEEVRQKRRELGWPFDYVIVD